MPEDAALLAVGVDSSGVVEGTQALKDFEEQSKKTEQTNERWLESQKRSAETLGKSRNEVLLMEAAQRGLSATQMQQVQDVMRARDAYEESSRSAAASAVTIGVWVEAVRRGTEMIIQLVQAYAQWQESNDRMNAMLDIVGPKFGRTSEQVHGLIEELSRGTAISGVTLTNAATSLMKFSGVTGDMFDRALKASADLAAMMGTDITHAAELVGRSLENSFGTMMLRRIGLLTDAQVDYLRTLKAVEGDQVYMAELMTLIEAKAGGLAVKLAETGLSGAWSSLTIEIGKSGRALAEWLDKTADLEARIRALVESLERMRKQGFEESMVPPWVEKLWGGLDKFMSQTPQGAGRILSGMVGPNVYSMGAEQYAQRDRDRAAQNAVTQQKEVLDLMRELNRADAENEQQTVEFYNSLNALSNNRYTLAAKEDAITHSIIEAEKQRAVAIDAQNAARAKSYSMIEDIEKVLTKQVDEERSRYEWAKMYADAVRTLTPEKQQAMIAQYVPGGTADDLVKFLTNTRMAASESKNLYEVIARGAQLSAAEMAKDVEKLKQEGEEIGKTKDAIASLRIEREHDNEAILQMRVESIEALKDNKNLTDEQKAGLESLLPALREQLALSKERQKVMADNLAAQQAADAVEENRKAWEDLGKAIQEAGRGALQTIQEQIDKQKEYNAQLGLTKEQIAAQKAGGIQQQIDQIIDLLRQAQDYINGHPLTVKIDTAGGKQDIKTMLDEVSAKYGIDKRVLPALAAQESGFNPNAINAQSRAKGMFQFMPDTAAAFGINPFDPRQAAEATAQMFVQNLERFGGDMMKAIMAHFAGPNTEKWGGKTQAYGQQVMGRIEAQGPSEYVSGVNVAGSRASLQPVAAKFLLDLQQPKEQIEQLQAAFKSLLSADSVTQATDEWKKQFSETVAKLAAALPLLQEWQRRLSESGALESLQRQNALIEEATKKTEDELQAIQAKNQALGLTKEVQDAIRSAQYDAETLAKEQELAGAVATLNELRANGNKDEIRLQELLIANMTKLVDKRKEYGIELAKVPAKDIEIASAEEQARLEQELQQLQQRGAEIGKTREEVDQLRAARQREYEVILKIQLADMEYALGHEARTDEERAAIMARVAALEKELDTRKKISEQQDANASKEAAAKATANFKHEWEGMFTTIDNGLADAILNGFEKGKNFAESFKQALTDMFKNLVLRPIIQFIMAPISGMLTNMFSGMIPGFGTGGQALLAQGGMPGMNFMGNNPFLPQFDMSKWWGGGSPYNAFAMSGLGQTLGLSSPVISQAGSLSLGVETAGAAATDIGLTSAGSMFTAAAPWAAAALIALPLISGLFDSEPSQVKGRFGIRPRGTTTGWEGQYTETKYGTLGFLDADTQYFSGAVGNELSKIIKGGLDVFDTRLSKEHQEHLATTLQAMAFPQMEGEYTTEDFIKKYGAQIAKPIFAAALDELDSALGEALRSFTSEDVTEIVQYTNALLTVYDATKDLAEADRQLALTMLDGTQAGADLAVAYANVFQAIKDLDDEHQKYIRGMLDGTKATTDLAIAYAGVFTVTETLTDTHRKLVDSMLDETQAGAALAVAFGNTFRTIEDITRRLNNTQPAQTTEQRWAEATGPRIPSAGPSPRGPLVLPAGLYAPSLAEDVEAAIGGSDPFRVFTTSARGLRVLLDTFDDTVEATEALTAATQAYYAAGVQLLAQYKQLKDQISGMFDDTLQTIKLSGMTQEEQYNYWREQATVNRQQMLNATNPADIQRYAQLTNTAISNAWNILQQIDRQQQDDRRNNPSLLVPSGPTLSGERQSFIEFINETTEQEQTRLTDLSTTVTDAMTDTLGEVDTRLSQSATTISEASAKIAASSDKIVAAADKMDRAGTNMLTAASTPVTLVNERGEPIQTKRSELTIGH